ncbi:hypothetical protein HY572_04910 [Candidatus Micrarchaeota archaeon]|nr:hypothetical protein [Candidatus Micrarchaeota archaeon]
MVLGIFETLAELGFVVQILSFTYILFWLYMTFRDLPLLFGITATVTGFLIFIHGVSVVLLTAAFVFLFLFGMQIQQVMWFGLFPLLGYHVMGDRLASAEETDPRKMQAKMQRVQEQIERGHASQQEMEWFQQQMAQNQVSGGGNQQLQQMQRMQLMQS